MKRESDEQNALAPANTFKAATQRDEEEKKWVLVCSPLESTPLLSTNRKDASQTSLFKGGCPHTLLAQQIQLHKQASKGPRYLRHHFDAAIDHAAAKRCGAGSCWLLRTMAEKQKTSRPLQFAAVMIRLRGGRSVGQT